MLCLGASHHSSTGVIAPLQRVRSIPQVRWSLASSHITGALLADGRTVHALPLLIMSTKVISRLEPATHARTPDKSYPCSNSITATHQLLAHRHNAELQSQPPPRFAIRSVAPSPEERRRQLIVNYAKRPRRSLAKMDRDSVREGKSWQEGC